MKKIFIYGAPASGKSRLERLLAEAINETAEDLDATIYRKTKKLSSDIIIEQGEQEFRKIESKVLREVVAKSDAQIIALGGGTLLDKKNLEYCREHGEIVCIDTPPEKELMFWIRKDGKVRPLGDQSKARAEHYASFKRTIHSVFDDCGTLTIVGENIADLFLSGEKVVADQKVARLRPWGEKPIFKVPSGEKYKNLETLSKIWSAFNKHSLGRKDRVVALGGGVTGDMVGFAAATWMRGIDWINIPTTLIAMTDAGIGGKTGIDLPEGKNLVGAFHLPRLTVVDLKYVDTLPASEANNWIGELTKCLIIDRDRNLLNKIETSRSTQSTLSALIKFKLDIIGDDVADSKGRRAVLNYGHTIGHAIEKASNYTISHGYAVAIGCVQEAYLAYKLGLASAKFAECVEGLFAKQGLPTQYPAGMSFKKLIPYMLRDKKKTGENEVEFALPYEFGDVRMTKVKLR